MTKTPPQGVGAKPTQRTRLPLLGIYGVSGSGKTTLCQKLKDKTQGQQVCFIDGSDVIKQHAANPGGWLAFTKAPKDEKAKIREAAITNFHADCEKHDRIGVITGHMYLWDDRDKEPEDVWTNADAFTYTHICSLDTPADQVKARRDSDNADNSKATRPDLSLDQIAKWQQLERSALEDRCENSGIVFTVLTDSNSVAEAMGCLRQELSRSNTRRSLKTIVEQYPTSVDTIVVLDADKTLAPQDTGSMFWTEVKKHYPQWELEKETDPLKAIFHAYGYTHNAFEMAASTYGGIKNDDYANICETVAERVVIYPELKSLLRSLISSEHARPLIITCGLQRVWKAVLEKAGFNTDIQVIGAGRANKKSTIDFTHIEDGAIVTGPVKKDLVERLQIDHNMTVWAFGDSPLDLDMLKRADQAIVVVGEETIRSKSMEEELADTINNDKFFARQVLLPTSVSPRLSKNKLPVVELDDGLVSAILGHRTQCVKNSVGESFHTMMGVLSLTRETIEYQFQGIYHASNEPSTKLLTAPTRDATNHGPGLRKYHANVGWYLANHFLGKIMGLQQYQIPHVQGYHTDGHRILHEKRTLIVPLMRGGEPMAVGVSEALPEAAWRHAKEPTDLKDEHMNYHRTIILVDAVVNTGESIVDFVKRIRDYSKNMRIIVMANVTQEDAVKKEVLAEYLKNDDHLFFITLRFSKNKYTGRGVTDTGGRLFNTTNLD